MCMWGPHDPEKDPRTRNASCAGHGRRVLLTDLCPAFCVDFMMRF